MQIYAFYVVCYISSDGTFRLSKLFDTVTVRAKADTCTAIAAHVPDKLIFSK